MNGGSALHPLIAAAAEGDLPEWAVASKKRRDHMARVAKLLKNWSTVRGESGRDIKRWTALGYLHDMMRDERPDRLRQAVIGEAEPTAHARAISELLNDVPGRALHGPATAVRLRQEGVRDGPLLTAVAFHTLGSAEFDEMGMALYAADFLEPGRRGRPRWREETRRRMPQDLVLVVRAILGLRIRYLIDRGRLIHPETIGFWNGVAKGKPWASASEL